MKETQQVTKCSNNKGFRGNSNILPRIKFSVTGQDSSPQSPTFHTADRYGQANKKKSFVTLSVELKKNALRNY